MAEMHTPCGTRILVDDADLEWLSAWSWHRYGSRRGGYYALRVECHKGSRKHTQMHRLIMDAAPGQLVDHINGDTFDNRRANLRFATISQNKANQQRAYGASGLKGVVWNKASRKWQAQIGHQGKSHYLGLHETKEAAAAAYDDAAVRLFGQFAKTNAMIRAEVK